MPALQASSPRKLKGAPPREHHIEKPVESPLFQSFLKFCAPEAVSVKGTMAKLRPGFTVVEDATAALSLA